MHQKKSINPINNIEYTNISCRSGIFKTIEYSCALFGIKSYSRDFYWNFRKNFYITRSNGIRICLKRK